MRIDEPLRSVLRRLADEMLRLVNVDPRGAPMRDRQTFDLRTTFGGLSRSFPLCRGKAAWTLAK